MKFFSIPSGRTVWFFFYTYFFKLLLALAHFSEYKIITKGEAIWKILNRRSWCRFFVKSFHDWQIVVIMEKKRCSNTNTTLQTICMQYSFSSMFHISWYINTRCTCCMKIFIVIYEARTTWNIVYHEKHIKTVVRIWLSWRSFWLWARLAYIWEFQCRLANTVISASRRLLYNLRYG